MKLCIFLCVSTVLLQNASCARQKTSSSEEPGSDNEIPVYHGKRNQMDRDIFSDKNTLDILNKMVSTSVAVFKDEQVRMYTLNILKAINSLLSKKENQILVSSFIGAMNKMMLNPENLNVIDKLLDLSHMALLDTNHYESVERGINLVNNYLDNKLATTIFSKIGVLMNRMTADTDESRELYLAAGRTFEQMTVLIRSKEKMKIMQDFMLDVHKKLTGKDLPPIVL